MSHEFALHILDATGWTGGADVAQISALARIWTPIPRLTAQHANHYEIEHPLFKEEAVLECENGLARYQIEAADSTAF